MMRLLFAVLVAITAPAATAQSPYESPFISPFVGPVVQPGEDVAGPPFYGLVFDGAQYVTGTTDNLGNATRTELTIMAWLYIPAHDGALSTIISQFLTTGNRRSYWFMINTENRLNIRLYNTGLNSAPRQWWYVNDVFPTGRWVHVAMVWEAGTPTLYQDAEIPAATATHNDAMTTYYDAATAGIPWYIGVADDTRYGLSGTMAQLYTYPRALSQSEIQAAMMGRPPAGASLAMPMQPGSGETVLDVSGNDRHGTMPGGAASPDWIKLIRGAGGKPRQIGHAHDTFWPSWDEWLAMRDWLAEVN